MKCNDCPFYKSGYMYNACALMQFECFMPLKECNLVNNDGTPNEAEMKKIEGEEQSK